MKFFRNVFIDPDEAIVVPGAQKQSVFMSVAVGMFAAVGGFIYGYDTGLINSISEMEYVRHQFAANKESFTTKETSIMTAILSLGTFFGALFAPVLSDNLGRRFAIIISTFVVFMVGNICQVSSSTLILFCIGRFITGLSVGIISAVVPVYQAEASPKFVRGAIIVTYQWAITWGLLVSSAVSQGTHALESSASYRVPIGLQFVWSFILGVAMIYLPESPRFYVYKDDINAAALSLSRLRRVPPNDPGLIEELVEIKASHDYEQSFGSYSIWDCFRSDEARPHQLKRLLTGVSLQALQQCSSINFIFYYGVNFFSKTGVSKSYLISFVTYAVNVVATVPGMFLVETMGRRKLLIMGGSLMAIANLITAIVGVTTDSIIANKIMIALVCVFIASFAASWGPVVWVVCGEIFSLGVRGRAASLTASTNWIVNFVFAYSTPYLVDTGKHTAALGTKIFFMWGGFNLMGIIFVYFTVYETKGLSLEEIDELYRGCPNAISSAHFKVVMNFNRPAADDENIASEKRDSTANTSSLPDSYSTTGLSPNPPVQSMSTVHYTPMHMEGDAPDYLDYNPSYSVDLGFGLGLTTQTRGPPSLLTMSTGDDSGFENEDDSTRMNYSSLNDYISRLSSMSDTGGGRNSNNIGTAHADFGHHLADVSESADEETQQPNTLNDDNDFEMNERTNYNNENNANGDDNGDDDVSSSSSESLFD